MRLRRAGATGSHRALGRQRDPGVPGAEPPGQARWRPGRRQPTATVNTCTSPLFGSVTLATRLPSGASYGFVAKTYVATGSLSAPATLRYAVLATTSLPYWTVPPPPPTVQSVKDRSVPAVVPSVNVTVAFVCWLPLTALPMKDSLAAGSVSSILWPAADALSGRPDGEPGQVKLSPAAVPWPPGVSPAAFSAWSE